MCNKRDIKIAPGYSDMSHCMSGHDLGGYMAERGGGGWALGEGRGE